jgi:hypothetical protein
MGITDRAVGRLQELKNCVENLGKRHHYQSWIAEFNEQEPMDDDIMELDAVTMEEYKSKFTETNFKEELAGFFPLLHSIMREANKVNLEDYVKEEATEEFEEDDSEVKENSFAQFEEWAEATEQGKLADDQIQVLKTALADTTDLQLGPDGQTAWQFFNGLGIEDTDLEDNFKSAASLDSTADPIEVFKMWAQESYPELLVALGMSDTQAPAEPAPVDPAAPPAPEQPVAEAPEDSTYYQVAKILADKGIKYDSSKEGELINAIGGVMANELGMDKKQVRYLIRYDDDFLADTLSALHHMNQDENTDMVPPPGAMEESEKENKGSMVQEVAKIVKSFYNRDNPEVGPFRGEEGIVIDVEKQISEKFGDEAGQQAGKMAEAFMQKLTQQWQAKHGQVANGQGDDGLARLKELLGNVKSKVEGIGDQGQGGKDFNKNIMPAEEEASHQTKTTMKHADNPTYQQRAAAQGIKPGIPGYQDRIAMLKDLERTGKLKKEDLTAFEDIMRLAGLSK